MKASEISGKKVLVIGTGLSGVGSVRLLHQVGAVPVMLEENTKVTKEDIVKKLNEEDRENTEIIIGEISDEVLDELVLVVPSPAVPLDAPTVLRIKEKNIPIWSEIELAYNFAKGKLVAITGTNGKTTTTTLVGEIMKAHFKSSYVVGNIGVSYAESALEMKEDTVTVGEISSFQLEAVDNFHAQVSAILNITPDHLNRHHTMECYAEMKQNITNNQTKEDTCVLNYDNPYTREFGEKCPAKVVFFSTSEKLKDGFYLDGEEIFMSIAGEAVKVMNIHDMNLVGMCNVENVMAAIAMAVAMGVPFSTILRVVREFKAVEHRIEFVATKNGVDYYNDSKGTNPDAAIQGIKAMSKPTILIGGGYDKGSEYDEWIENFGDTVKMLVLIGQTKEKIAECAQKHGFNKFVFKDTFEEALEYCSSNAKEGEAVLLSPACASWDMFPNYETRGKKFKEYVNRL
ncbi:MAG: UDP-N-acetylmuramoyl-L-alanine--D-glutamate ligase [Butyrivibrio sp.]|jgi:UDP-N-acetylmuramoylalanine--D-glutamate ligase|nr:UDP-N-acetylmuramoyl-L-alanine--D-glutamate ligase [Butyrivibrio sp.]MBQ4220063.1 UDP-N-acetylmuramoyl-L-alanine--D-glutamate ligase [Butyrivibrio sp.]MBR4356623.1 UDP-N-acetylmuramoyl-L-alanine--D-glutamate ligase [Butyrivibrio sp.]MBR4640866.1 UDP-N-acetylmuramoyl-L-alanine--D-glutamate ligase [Butyrivibrio sp.]MEE3470697.1 UDP-N-acetylmuramoyl-L-alanine--D-glutamate ligase [Butyrivibrio hungatei]